MSDQDFLSSNDSALNRFAKSLIFKITSALSLYSQTQILILSFVLLIFIASLNVVVHQKLSLSIFYLLPICLVTWYTTRHWGIFVALLSAVALTLSHANDIITWRQWVAQLWNTSGTLGLYFMMVIMLRLVKIRLENEKTLAQHDPLTALSNRRAFMKNLSLEILRARRYAHPLTLAVIDLDHFKTVNDELGHQAGDRLLKSVAQTLRDNTRSTDSIARLGGDEFAVLLPETKPDKGALVMQRLNKELDQIMKIENWPVTFSIGVGCFAQNTEGVDETLHKVDSLMYEVKKTGKNGMKTKIF